LIRKKLPPGGQGSWTTESSIDFAKTITESTSGLQGCGRLLGTEFAPLRIAIAVLSGGTVHGGGTKQPRG
jgi:hypothetical protein